MSDPRYTDPRLSDPALRHQEAVGGKYGWVAGIAVLVLIGFLIIAGLNGNSHIANNNTSPATTGTATRQMNSAEHDRLGRDVAKTAAAAADNAGAEQERHAIAFRVSASISCASRREARRILSMMR